MEGVLRVTVAEDGVPEMGHVGAKIQRDSLLRTYLRLHYPRLRVKQRCSGW